MDDASKKLAIGRELHVGGKLTEAEALYRELLVEYPSQPEIWRLLGVIRGQKNDPNGAVECFQQALLVRPDFALASDNLGTALRQLNQVDQAIMAFERACAIAPENPLFKLNLGTAVSLNDDLDRAESLYKASLELQPNSPDAWVNLSVVFRERQNFVEAEVALERALALDPNHRHAHFNLGHQKLLSGDFGIGWREYRWRNQNTKIFSKEMPEWRGESLKGKSLLLLAEQGLGDTLFASRYFSQLHAAGARLTLFCQKQLVPLMRVQPYLDKIVGEASGIPPQDFAVSVMSLPLILGERLLGGEFKGGGFGVVPAISVDEQTVADWSKRISHLAGLKVGIAWQGNPNLNRDYLRSVPLEDFSAVAKLDNVSLISLQKGYGAEQIADFDFPIVDVELDLGVDRNFLDTAALMKNLDLVITTCNSIANLAGVMGLPAMIALQQVPDWRWMLEDESSRWYPSLKLFRQSERRNWKPVFERIAGEVKKHTYKHRGD